MDALHSLLTLADKILNTMWQVINRYRRNDIKPLILHYFHSCILDTILLIDRDNVKYRF